MKPKTKKCIQPRFKRKNRLRTVRLPCFGKRQNIHGSHPFKIESTQPNSSYSDETVETKTTPLQYDENLLERARMQWQFGDWERLSKLDDESLKNHPDRSKLALLAAAGHIQLGAINQAKKYFRMAQYWGCDTGLIRQFLVAGIHTSIGRAYAVLGQAERAAHHIESAIEAGTPGADTSLLLPIRMKTQFEKPGAPDCRLSGIEPNEHNE